MTMDNTTWDERLAKASDLQRTLGGVQAPPERLVKGMENRLGPLGTWAVSFVLGDLWSRPQLSRRDRSLIVICFLATLGSTEELKAHLQGGLNHGLSKTEIEGLIAQVAGYAGYPMAMQAMRVVDEAFKRADKVDELPKRVGAPHLDDDARHANAMDVLNTLFGGRVSASAEEQHATMQANLGGIADLVFNWAFGELWANDALSRRDRSLATIAIIAMLGKERELKIHVRGGLNHGLQPDEIREVMVQLACYGGFPRAVEGMRAVNESLEKAAAKS